MKNFTKKIKIIIFLHISFILIFGTLNAKAESVTTSYHIDTTPTISIQLDNSNIKIKSISNANELLITTKSLSNHTGKRQLKNSCQKARNNDNIVKIKKNTDNITHYTKLNWLSKGWNQYGKITAIIAFLTLLASGLTYRSQKNTENNTSKAPIEMQLWKLKDLPRHFYRNLVCTRALYILYKEAEKNGRGKYPSESNVLKLQTLPDDIVLPINFKNNKDIEKNPSRYAHELKLLLRNYNIEVTVASDHFSRREISESSLAQDFDNLFFKPLKLTTDAFQYEKLINTQSEDFLVPRTIYKIISEHFKKLQDPFNFKLLFTANAQRFLIFDDNYIADFIKDAEDGSDKKDKTKGSIYRAINSLLKHGNKEADNRLETGNIKEEGTKKKGKEDFAKLSGIIYEETGSNYEATIIRKTAEKKLIELEKDLKTFLGVNSEESTFHPGFLSISNAEDFIVFCTKFKYIKDTIEEINKAHELHKKISPYLEYLHRSTWDFRTLFRYMLTIDAAIETDRIGMIEYHNS